MGKSKQKSANFFVKTNLMALFPVIWDPETEQRTQNFRTTTGG
jgi:hypothetical protein